MSRREKLIRRLEAPLSARGAAGRLLLAGLLTVLGIVAVVLVSLWHAPAADRTATGDELRRQAGPLIAEIFSADADTWDADRDRARELVGGPLRTSLSAGLSAGVPEGVRAVQWQPLAVGVVDQDRDRGTALVVVRVVVIPTQGLPTESVKSVNADFQRSGDRWLLVGMDELQ